ncbi:hypothetical protein NOX35_12185 [Comamonas sp. C11]|nr:RHS repeat-associated core domain-containing protein [Comamonas sp. C11]UUC95993.1 hypothetical protein NOX35_12185 [Comamonas sp. C11]
MRGQLVKSTECSAQPTHYRDDKRHFLVEVTDAQDESLQYDYDKAGRPIEARGAEGGAPGWWPCAMKMANQTLSGYPLSVQGTARLPGERSYRPHCHLRDPVYLGGAAIAGGRARRVPLVYVYEDQKSYAPLARIDGRETAQVYYYHCQPNGLPEAQGNEYWRGTCNSWGKASLETGDANLHHRHQNLRLQGQYLDRETGLHYNLFRYYDPDIGRFTQQDPIGLEGGSNLYRFTKNPMVWADPFGLDELYALTALKDGWYDVIEWGGITCWSGVLKKRGALENR